MVTADPPRWLAATSAGTFTGTFIDRQPSVEVAPTVEGVHVRDTKDHGAGPVLVFDHDEWIAFVTAAVAGVPIPTVTVADAITRHHGIERRTCLHVSSPRSAIPLHFTKSEWTAFLARARDGEFAFGTQRALATA
jgi:hypothetical protein